MLTKDARQRHPEIPPLLGRSNLEKEALLFRLAHAREHAAVLRLELDAALSRLRALERPGRQSSLYASVGLHPDCPDFVLKAARRAYRRVLHPDTKPCELRADAERRFKHAEGVFDRIGAARS